MRSTLLWVLTTIALWVASPSLASAQQQESRHYSKERPLVYEDAWDLWPYVYLNEHGKPEGFNVDMLKMLLEKLDIPYVIKLKPTANALEDLKAGRSDLMLGMRAAFHDEYALYGSEVVQLFTHSVVFPKSAPDVIQKFDDLANHRVIVHGGSFSHHLMIDKGWKAKSIPYDDMKEAIQKVSTDNKGYIVWNTLSLKWLMNKFNTTNLQIKPVDIMHGEYRFMSNDSVLLHQLDSVYALLRSNDQLVPVLNKWFYPERVDSGIPEWVHYVGVAVGIMAFLMLYYTVVLHYREKRVNRLIDKHNRQLALILRTTKVRVFLYNVKRQTLSWMNTNGEMGNSSHRVEDYKHLFTPSAYALLGKALKSIVNGSQEKCVVEMTTDTNYGKRDNVITLSVFRRQKQGMPQVIVGIVDDQTESHIEQRQVKDRMLRYQSIFSTSMVDMTYYNTEGILSEINQKACETLHCNREELLAERVPFTYAIEDPDMTVKNFEGSYTTHFLKKSGHWGRTAAIHLPRNIYYEQQLVPVYHQDKRFVGIFGFGRDVTEFVESYHQLKRSIVKTMLAAEDVTEYINNINYALHVGGVRLATYSPDTHTLTIFKEMNVVQLKLPQARCVAMLEEESKRVVRRFINNMDNRSTEPVDVDIKTIIRTTGNRKLALQFHFFPVFTEDNKVDYYFGLCLDITEETVTAEELEREKAKAQEVESVKNAFLRNMSHEIRTPITTVVGFAELFSKEHNLADESGFIQEIKSNATFLLKLVNDILFLSRLDAHMVEFNKEPVDFAMTFEGHCQMGWGKNGKDGVNYILENPYEHLMVVIDDSNVGHIIEQLAANAADNTDAGEVRARYDYIGDKLLITIDDTGRGYDEERQSTMFERFDSATINKCSGSGTGLGLPICKELALQMGGDIVVNTAAGRGTTVWLIIPCEATLVEKKLRITKTEMT